MRRFLFCAATTDCFAFPGHDSQTEAENEQGRAA